MGLKPFLKFKIREPTILNSSKRELSLHGVIIAACTGTLIEWYDFFVFGALASTLDSQFYKTGTPDGDLIAWLATFAVGFIVRPFGAVLFGYLGDKVGRKFTFTLSLALMGGCTFLMGCIPTYKNIGTSAGYILIFLRLIQGLAIGGEYSGAATYVSEHAPHGKIGFYTSFIQATATFGMIMSLAIILLLRVTIGATEFDDWGWRIPFLISIFLVGVSFIIRLRLGESPIYQELKDSGQLSKNPLVESFGNRFNLYYVALALFGATIGQGCVWYTSQFYSLIFITKYAHIPTNEAYQIVLVALICGSPLFILVGYLSDKFGRKPLMLAGFLLATTLWYPIYIGLYKYGYSIGGNTDLVSNQNYSPFMIGFLIWIQVGFSALVYGPIAAFLVELFPTSIRYTSMSLPYHLGTGLFGGLVPVIAVSIVTSTGNIYGGLWFPMACASMTFLVMLFLVPETYQISLTGVPER